VPLITIFFLPQPKTSRFFVAKVIAQMCIYPNRYYIYSNGGFVRLNRNKFQSCFITMFRVKCVVTLHMTWLPSWRRRTMFRDVLFWDMIEFLKLLILVHGKAGKIRCYPFLHEATIFSITILACLFRWSKRYGILIFISIKTKFINR